MRVIAGSARRTTLDVAPGSSTRPFLEMARGALMNSLAARLPGARVLDLYAGSGALGIEALSRGADEAVFIEADRRAERVLLQNLERCRLTDRARVLRGRCGTMLEGLTPAFDLIFADPPFAQAEGWEGDPEGARVMAEAARLVAEEGRVVFRLEREGPEAPRWPGFKLVRDRRYGRSRVCEYVLADEGGENG